MKQEYQLEKTLWTDTDFDVMGWHDCPVHALSFDDEDRFLLDIDYMFEWVLKKNKRNYLFRISPCTLVFDNVYDIVLETDHTKIIIDNISRENPRKPKNAAPLNEDLEYDWTIETTVGVILFRSTGFKQYIRKAPVLIGMQQLNLEERGGISFNRMSFA
ncbi:hypothetical protein G7092_22720 [Mucilaginibacter sp. HC2]|uniref:hypothetical protein n=1 Tax=Mucilaginibacter inviolabilis TaxID=2714892 RepID=UPI00140E1805|nr:hypothetical protein [Mucilaginibacter inviolabilis]NHA06636.1 hypothetical protein [Mucilaginibacter inviolabilis]